ncbi:hypothetical protein RhiirA4_481165 [Rhizophagus irregularis]|uniref:Uncharacterized protein n=1 Tax=Rhizophagus irregularis TaxID=588596 RepID=A0A2I1HJ22_9GLOM|nr:hypothetical protein RhiirA4_481165 [Rhizophagus irregularis]
MEGLDSAWTHKFLKEAEEINPDDFSTLKKNSHSNSSNIDGTPRLQAYWEEVIYKRKKLRVKRTHVFESLSILDEARKYNVGNLILEGLLDFFPVNVSFTSKRTLNNTILTSSKRIKKIRNVELGQGKDDNDENYEIEKIFSLGSQPISFCNANNTEVFEEEYAYLQEILSKGVKLPIPNKRENEIEDVSTRKKVKKSIKSTYSVKYPQLRNSKKSFSDFSSSSGSDEIPDDNEEIKFNLLSISIKLECEPTCKVSSSLHDATHKNLINGNVFMNDNVYYRSSCVPEVAPLKLSEEEYAYYVIKINYSFIVNQFNYH